MNDTIDPRVRRYVRALERELGAVPAAQRRLIVEGVEEHIVDALDEGRAIDEVLAGLGTPREAAASHAEEPGARPDPSRYARRVLGVIGVAVAVLAAAAAPLVSAPTPETTALDVAVMILVLVLPIAMLLAPALMPVRGGAVAAWAFAVILLVTPVAWLAGAFAGTALDDVAWLLFPTAFVAWAAAIVPPATRWSRGARLSLRIVGGVLAALPGVLVMVGSLSGTVGSVAELVLSAALGLGIGALFVGGWRWMYVLLTGLGLGVAAFGMVGGGLLVLAFVVVGGLWIALGASGLATRPWRR